MKNRNRLFAFLPLILLSVLLFSVDPIPLSVLIASPYVPEPVESGMEKTIVSGIKSGFVETGVMDVGGTEFIVVAKNKSDYLSKCFSEGKKRGVLKVIASVLTVSGKKYILEFDLLDIASGEVENVIVAVYADAGKLSIGLKKASARVAEALLPSINILAYGEQCKPAIEMFQKLYPGVKVNLEIIDRSEYPSTLAQKIYQGDFSADLIWAYQDDIGKILKLEIAQSLEESPYEAGKLNLFQSAKDYGRNDQGQMMALPVSIYPVAVFYKRELAKKYFGSDDPTSVAKHFSSFENIVAAARIVKEKSGGKDFLINGIEDLRQLILGARTEPWIKNGTFAIPQEILNVLDVLKPLFDEKLCAGTTTWSSYWTDGMNRDDKVMAYFFPDWGWNYVIKSNNQSGVKWGQCAAPVNIFWGGEWVIMNKDSSEIKKQAVWKFMTMLGGKEYQMQSLDEIKIFMSNRDAMKELSKTTPADAALSGQNLFEVLYDTAEKIKVHLPSSSNTNFEDSFFDYAMQYVKGKISKEDLIQQVQENSSYYLNN